MLPFAPAVPKPSPLCLLSLSVFSLFPSPFCRLSFSFLPFFSFLFYNYFSFLLPLSFHLPLLLPLFSSPPHALLPFAPQLTALPHPFTFIPPSALLSLSPARPCSCFLVPLPPALHPLCSLPGGPVPLTVGGAGSAPCLSLCSRFGDPLVDGGGELGSIWVHLSDPVPLSPQKVEEVGAWALGQGAGLAPPPFLPTPILSP